jgi:small-conductance mechanosensitive channel
MTSTIHRNSVVSILALCGLVVLPGVAVAQAPTPANTAAVEPSGQLEPGDWARDAVAGATIDAPPATLSFHNRPIVELRATVMSRTPAMRAAAAERFLSDLADGPPLGRPATRPFSGAVMVSVGATDVFALVPADVDLLRGQTLEDVAAEAASSLQVALDEAIEGRTLSRIVAGVLWVLGATVLVVVLLRLLVRVHGVLATRIAAAADRELQRLPGGEVLAESMLKLRLRQFLSVVSVGLGLIVAYSWLTFSLRQFAYTRPWGESLRGFLLERLVAFGGAFITAIPDLFTVILIVVVTRLAAKLVGTVFIAAAQGRAVLPGVHPDTAITTRRLATLLLWLFALALAYPYLPGSETDAFKGVSVFVGLIISFGSSGIVNQVMSGLTLTYSRAVQAGDYVKIGDVEGTITNLGLLATKVKTPRREEVTIPNAVMVSTVTTNYTRLQPTEGVLVATSITIGYDVPWRQVHALLLLAAERSSGLRRDPPPRVLQTGLRDFNVEYTLLVCLEDPAAKGPTLDALHGQIQDAFNQFGVQIMSPNYEADPSGPKIVPPEHWFAAPATAPQPDQLRAHG